MTELYGQPFKPGDRVQVVGGIWQHKPRFVFGTVKAVHRNKTYMDDYGPVNPVLTIEYDEPIGERKFQDWYPEQLRFIK